MFKNKTKFMTIVVMTLIFFIDAFAGGDRRNGTAGAQELLIPISAKGLSLGAANLSSISGLDAIFYNPAGVGLSTNVTEAMFSYMNYIADIGYSFAAVSVNLDEIGSVGFSFRTMDFGEIPVTNEANPYGTGATYSPSYFIVSGTYSNSITDRIRVGFNVNLISESIQSSSASGFSFDAGIQYSNVAMVEGLSLGLTLKNIGGEMTFDGPDLLRKAEENIDESSRGTQFYKIAAASFELPTQLLLGLSYTTQFEDMYTTTISSAYQSNSFSNDEINMSLEFDYNDLIFLRGGYSYIDESRDLEEESIFGPTFGAGIKIESEVDITFDYGYRWARYFDANHIFSIKLGY